VKTTSYYVAAVAAFSIWGFFSLALKPLAVYPSLDILFYRVFLSAAILFVISVFVRRKVLREARDLYAAASKDCKRGMVLQVLGGGLFLMANWYSFIYVTNSVSLKAASFAYLVCPVLTTVLAYFILRERLGRWQWVSVWLSLFGCLLLAFNSLADLFYSLLIAVSYALYLVSQRRNFGMDRLFVLTLQVVFSALLLLPFYPVSRGRVPQEAFFYELIVLIALLFTILPLFLNLYALKGLPSSTVGILLYLTPLLGFIVAIGYYSERVSLLQGVAYGIIALSVILFNVESPAPAG
jgi:chloramphenicol-sensitive protein RarD